MRYWILSLFAIIILSSCRIVRPSIMLKTPENYNYAKLVDSLSTYDYRIAPNDAVVFRVFSNDGFKLIDLTNTFANVRGDIDLTVDIGGYLKLPLLNKVQVSGLTIREAENLLEKRYEEYYVKPYVTLRVTNRRVIVFPGSGGAARVVPIANNNTTIFEALALAGGIYEDGKAYKVKLVRNGNKKAEVYLMDLSTIDGVIAGNTLVQANDLIYVEPRIRFAQKLAAEIIPYLTLVSTSLLLYQVLRR
jgi:polysaccharide export outer membrane protein